MAEDQAEAVQETIRTLARGVRSALHDLDAWQEGGLGAVARFDRLATREPSDPACRRGQGHANAAMPDKYDCVPWSGPLARFIAGIAHSA